MKTAAAEASKELGYLSKLGTEIKNIWNDTWNAIMGWGRSDLTSSLESAKKKLSDAMRTEIDANLDAGFSKTQREMAEASVKAIEREIEAQTKNAQAKKDASDAASELKKRLEGEKKAREDLAKSAEQGMSDIVKKEKERAEIHKQYSVAIAGAIGDEQKQLEIAKNYELALAGLNKTKESSTKSSKASSDSLKEYNSTLKQFSDMQIEATGSAQELTKAQVLMQKVVESDWWKTIQSKPEGSYPQGI
jgi:hypothetical protein